MKERTNGNVRSERTTEEADLRTFPALNRPSKRLLGFDHSRALEFTFRQWQTDTDKALGEATTDDE
jgi:hypothetical protein